MFPVLVYEMFPASQLTRTTLLLEELFHLTSILLRVNLWLIHRRSILWNKTWLKLVSLLCCVFYSEINCIVTWQTSVLCTGGNCHYCLKSNCTHRLYIVIIKPYNNKVCEPPFYFILPFLWICDLCVEVKIQKREWNGTVAYKVEVLISCLIM